MQDVKVESPLAQERHTGDDEAGVARCVHHGVGGGRGSGREPEEVDAYIALEEAFTAPSLMKTVGNISIF